jgi:hypothetical protein
MSRVMMMTTDGGQSLAEQKEEDVADRGPLPVGDVEASRRASTEMIIPLDSDLSGQQPVRNASSDDQIVGVPQGASATTRTHETDPVAGVEVPTPKVIIRARRHL